MNGFDGSSPNEKTVFREIRTIETVFEPESDVHFHDSMEISVVLSGGGLHRIFGKTLPCAEGEIYIIPENVPHGFFLSESSDRLVVETLRFRPADWFDGEILAEESPRYLFGVFSDGTSLAYAKLTSGKVSEITALTKEISDELAAGRSGWEEAVRSYLSLIFIKVSRSVETMIKAAPDVPKKAKGTVSSVLRIIEERLGESDLTLDTIAASLHVSPSHLSRLFRQYMGQSFADFIRNYRMDRACRLLAETDEPVTEIVRDCGLKDVPSFYRSFSRYQGTTPNQYRNRSRERASEQKGKNKKRIGDKTMSILNDISQNLQNGKAKIVKELVQQALSEGIDAETILEEGLISGMNIIGEKFKNNEIYIPEVLVAARALNMGTGVLKPYFGEAGVETIGRVCIGTVEGDLHDIGKNLVKMMLEGKRLEVIDLGTDVSADTFVKTAIEQNCQIICCSALLTTTMGVMREVVEKLKAAGMDGKIKVMIGGAPINEDYCKKIGADVYTVDAASAADAAVEICRAFNV